MRVFTLTRRKIAVAAAIGLSTGFAPVGRKPSVDAISVTVLRTEYAVNPVGIDVTRPRLSWQLRTAGRDVVQSAYQVQVGTDSATLPSTSDGAALLWD
jgi:alpha-L-rhamnosidase